VVGPHAGRPGDHAQNLRKQFLKIEKKLQKK
jgi:hypothetical protein